MNPRSYNNLKSAGRNIMKLVLSFFIVIILIGTLLLSSCITIGAPKQSSAVSSDPLLGEWQMTRLSINPAIPLPDIVINQIINDKANWKIARQAGQLTINYSCRDTWYNPIIGIPVQKKTPTVIENQTKTSCSFTGGGSINIDKLPILLSIVSPQKMEQININFDDKVQINLASVNKLSSVITFNASGRYYGETEFGGSMKLKTLQQNTIVTYEGIKN